MTEQTTTIYILLILASTFFALWLTKFIPIKKIKKTLPAKDPIEDDPNPGYYFD